MKHILLAAVILIAVPAFGQEVKHAPPAEQCRADYDVWKAFQDADSSMAGTTIRELQQREKELELCGLVDPLTKVQIREYMYMALDFDRIRYVRLSHFIDRHNLDPLFLKEDEAGAR